MFVDPHVLRQVVGVGVLRTVWQEKERMNQGELASSIINVHPLPDRSGSQRHPFVGCVSIRNGTEQDPIERESRSHPLPVFGMARVCVCENTIRKKQNTHEVINNQNRSSPWKEKQEKQQETKKYHHYTVYIYIYIFHS